MQSLQHIAFPESICYFLYFHRALLFFYFLWQITSWLKKTFENQLVPQFDVNTKTTDLLYELVEYSEERERDVSFLIEDMKKRAAEYDAGGELKATVVSFFRGFFIVLL